MGMDYDKNSFIAGIAVGRDLKGWSVADLSDEKKLEHLNIPLPTGREPYTAKPDIDRGIYGFSSVTVPSVDIDSGIIKHGEQVYGITGTYGPDEQGSVNLAKLQSTITKNGPYNYTPTFPNQGYSQVQLTVNVPQEVNITTIDAKLQTNKKVVLSKVSDTFEKDAGYDGLKSITVTVDGSLTADKIVKGERILGVEGTQDITPIAGKPIVLTVNNIGNKQRSFTPGEGEYYSQVIVPGSADLISKNIIEGKTIFGVKGTHKDDNLQEEITITPRSIQQIKEPEGDYIAIKKVVVRGDTNLKSENIAQGVSIFGVQGTHAPKVKMQSLRLIPEHFKDTGYWLQPATPGIEGYSEVYIPPLQITEVGEDFAEKYDEAYAKGYEDCQSEFEELKLSLENQIAILQQENANKLQEGYELGYQAGLNFNSFITLDEESF